MPNVWKHSAWKHICHHDHSVERWWGNDHHEAGNFYKYAREIRSVRIRTINIIRVIGAWRSTYLYLRNWYICNRVITYRAWRENVAFSASCRFTSRINGANIPSDMRIGKQRVVYELRFTCFFFVFGEDATRAESGETASREGRSNGPADRHESPGYRTTRDMDYYPS